MKRPLNGSENFAKGRVSLNEFSMSRILLPLFLAFLAASVPGQESLREVDLRVRGIGSESSYSSVIAKLGRPISRKSQRYTAEDCIGRDATILTLRYRGLTVELLGDRDGKDFEVIELIITSPRWAASGVKIGASTNEVVRRFGDPISKEPRNNRTVYHYVTPDNLGNVNFEFQRGRLVKILMSETLC